MSSSRLGVQSASLPFDQHNGRGGESIYQQLRDLTLSREISRSPARAPPVRSPSRSSRHSPTQQLSKSVTDWLSGDGRSQRIEPSMGGDRRSRATERDRDSGRGRRRSISTSTQSSLVSHSRSRSRGHHSRRRAHSPVSTELGSQTSYSSSSRPKSHTSHRHRHHHHQHRRDRSYSSSRSRSSSRERTKREKKKALKTGLLLLGGVAAATAAAQKLWSSDAARDERKNREAERRDNRSGHHHRRTSRERVRDPPNRERLSVKDGAGVKPTPTLSAPASVASTRMRVEPPRSVYHPHYEETQYAAAPDDGEAIWMPEEESIGWNSRGEVVVETIERRVGPPSEAASKRKSHGGRRSGNDDRGDEDAYRGVEKYKIMDEWDPRWKKY